MEADFSLPSIFRYRLAKSGTFAAHPRLDLNRLVGVSSPRARLNGDISTCLERVRVENFAIARVGKVVYSSEPIVTEMHFDSIFWWKDVLSSSLEIFKTDLDEKKGKDTNMDRFF